MQWPLKVEVLLVLSYISETFFNLLSSDILVEVSDYSYHMSFSTLVSQMDLNFLKTYTPHVTMVLQLLVYSCCYGYSY